MFDSETRAGTGMITIIPAIMSGGSGTRLWPLSTDDRPKQFHALSGERTMIQETALRLTGDLTGVEFGAPIVIGNAAQAHLIEEQLRGAGVEPAMVILEPVGRNTAATAALAALAGRELDPNALVLLVPADHVIADAAAFRDLIGRTAAFAHERIVTFGIVPDRPDIGYGYIEMGAEIAPGVQEIARFKEKPELAKAQEYVASRRFLWNAGMFMFAPELMLREFAASADILEGVTTAWKSATRDGVNIVLGPTFADVRSAPVDVAVMERTKRGAVAPCSVGWADVGSWSELWRLAAPTPDANVTRGPVALMECEGVLVHADGVVVAAAGLKDLIIVAVDGAVLILPKDRAQDVKQLRAAALALIEQHDRTSR